MTIPNILTTIRFVLAAVGCIALLAPFPFHLTVAGLLFLIAAITDYFDGFLARRWNAGSQWGTFMDPLADKLLVFLYLTHFTMAGIYPEWLFMAILTRDLITDGLRNFAASKKVIVGANFWSKIKTALQMASLIMCLLSFSAGEFQWGTANMWQMGLNVAVWCMVVSLACGLMGSARFLQQYVYLLTSGE